MFQDYKSKFLNKLNIKFVKEYIIYSLYTLDCINNNVKIITINKNKKNITKFLKNFIFVKSNFSDLKDKIK